MRKIYRRIITMVALLLCSVMVSSTLLSSTFAKYATSGTSSDGARVAKWGIEISSTTDLKNTYTSKTDNEIILVTSGSTGDKLFAPGTSGIIAGIRIKGAPEVMYNIDFSGELKIGKEIDNEIVNGFEAESRLIRDENGYAIEYFPIVLRLREYDVTEAGGEEIYTLCKDYPMSVRRQQENGTAWYSLYNHSEKRPDTLLEKGTPWGGVYTSLSALVDTYNSESNTHRIHKAFDATNQAPNTEGVDKLYTLEWEWKYTPEKSSTSYDYDTSTYNVGYQSTYLDTALGEAIAANKDIFMISSTMTATVTQSQGT